MKELVLIAGGLAIVATLMAGSYFIIDNKNIAKLFNRSTESYSKIKIREAGEPSSFKSAASSVASAAQQTKPVLLERAEVVEKINTKAKDFNVKNPDLVDQGTSSYLHFRGSVSNCQEAEMLEKNLAQDENVFESHLVSAKTENDHCDFYMTILLTNIK